MACPVVPRIPQEVLMRFRTMRDYDSKLATYSTQLCSTFLQSSDLTDLQNQVAALQATVALLVQRVTDLENASTSITAGTGEGVITWVYTNTSPYTVTAAEIGVRADSSAIPLTINLPEASLYVGQSIYIKDDAGTAGTNNITVVPFGSDTIDDDTSLVIDADYTGVELKSSGTGWEVL